MPGRSVAEVQADPEFQALSPEAQDKVLTRIRAAGAASYKGAPDLPLEPGLGDVSNKTAGTAARVAGPAAGAMLGPPGFLASLLASGAVGAGSAALGQAAEGKPMDPVGIGLGAIGNAGAAAASRPLGALGGVLASKMRGTRIPGNLDLSAVKPVAQEAANARGLVGQRVSGAGEKIAEILEASGGSLPINAPGLKPSAELIRKGIPFRQPGGKEMYGAFRGAAKANPDYDKLLQQYRSMHALTDMPSFRELMGAMATGGAGLGAGGLPGLLAILLPRLAKSAKYAPAAPGVQAGMSAAPSLLDVLQ